MNEKEILAAIKHRLEIDAKYYLKIDGNDIGIYAQTLLISIRMMEEHINGND